MNQQRSNFFKTERNQNPVQATDRQAILANPGFGKYFTDHMVTLRYTPDKKWHDGKISPREGFDMHPATMVFHYAAEIFEGLKVYRQPDGGAALFRPSANAQRFQQSAERLAMPSLPTDYFLESIRELASLDRAWIPGQEGASLYLRPFMISTQVSLGAKPSQDYLYCVIASPVAAYFSGGSAGVKLWVSDKYCRAAPGGTGAAKCGGNYAASLAAQLEGQHEGCEQAVFLDAIERKWVEELGGMNVFFVFKDGSIQTPPLGGTILPGVTRDSLIKLAPSCGLTVREERYSIDQWQEDAKSGHLTEAFACGTAAVITPIGQIKGRRHDFIIGDGSAGPITSKLKTTLTGIQYGRLPDPHNWLDRIV